MTWNDTCDEQENAVRNKSSKHDYVLIKESTFVFDNSSGNYININCTWLKDSEKKHLLWFTIQRGCTISGHLEQKRPDIK